MPVPGYRERFPEEATLNQFLRSESDFIENGRKEKAFQVEQRPRGKKYMSCYVWELTELAGTV